MDGAQGRATRNEAHQRLAGRWDSRDGHAFIGLFGINVPPGIGFDSHTVTLAIWLGLLEWVLLWWN